MRSDDGPRTPRDGRRRSYGILALVGCLVSAGAATAQPEPLDRFSETIDVRLLELEVVVTDGEGQRVSGLPRDAFEVLVAGTSRPVSFFTEYRAAAAPEDSGQVEQAEPPPPSSYLVFIDDLLNLERNRDLVVRNLRQQLGSLRAGDRMAVVRYAGGKLDVLAEWTPDRTGLEEALDEALAAPAGGIKYIALRRMEDYVANWEGNDTRRSVLAAAAALRALPLPEGRRALLLVAGSWDPVELSRSDDFSPWCLSGGCEGATVYDVLTDTANLLGYSIYAVDVEGRDPDANWSREKRLQSILGELARVTGGRRFLNGQRRDLLSLAVEDRTSYYSLGVEVPVEVENLRQSVEVRVLRAGLVARSQAAFVPVSAERNRQLEVLNTLLDARPSDDGLRLRPATDVQRWGLRMELPVALDIPLGSLSWTEGPAGPESRFSIELAWVDYLGNSSAVLRREVRLIRGPASPASRVVFPFRFELRRRRHTLVAFVRDHRDPDRFVATTADIAPRRQAPPPSPVGGSR